MTLISSAFYIGRSACVCHTAFYQFMSNIQLFCPWLHVSVYHTFSEQSLHIRG